MVHIKKKRLKLKDVTTLIQTGLSRKKNLLACGAEQVRGLSLAVGGFFQQDSDLPFQWSSQLGLLFTWPWPQLGSLMRADGCSGSDVIFFHCTNQRRAGWPF